MMSQSILAGDVWVDNTSNLEVLLKASKTDPFRQDVLGRSRADLCPLTAFVAYIWFGEFTCQDHSLSFEDG